MTDRGATALAVTGVSDSALLAGDGSDRHLRGQPRHAARDGHGSQRFDDFALDWESLRHLILPAITLSVIPAGIIARSVRSTVAEVRKQEFVQTLYAKGLPARRVFVHVVKNAVPTVLAIMGLQLAQLARRLDPRRDRVLLARHRVSDEHARSSTRDLPILQGTILVLSMFFVLINLLVDIVQSAFDPRIKRADAKVMSTTATLRDLAPGCH